MSREFKEGDIVRVRNLQDMIDEFGRDSDDMPDVLYGFNDEMASLCGRTAVVASSLGVGGGQILRLTSHDGRAAAFERWSWSTDMLEPALIQTKYPSNFRKLHAT